MKITLNKKPLKHLSNSKKLANELTPQAAGGYDVTSCRLSLYTNPHK
ncbi:hypothetical protein [Pseudoalteromonas piscicida]